MVTIEGWLLRVKRAAGVDAAIAYTVGARSLQILGSVGVVLLIVRFLSPIEQGYYYTVLSLAALQVVFELGFSTVILQTAAHENVFLDSNRVVAADQSSKAYGRLASLLQKTIRWYACAGALMLITLLPAGRLFFHKVSSAASPVSWETPWCLAAVACVGGFVMTPMYSFLEGCGLIRQVACMRLAQVFVGIVLGWTAMLSHHGLYAPGLTMLSATVVGLPTLWIHRSLLLPLARLPLAHHQIDWRTEIWPFQWKTAISSFCAFFTSQVFTLILFAFRSPREAGQMGMSLSITFYLNSLVGPWMSTKAPTFGGMAAKCQLSALDALYSRTLRQSVSVITVIALVGEVCLIGLSRFVPQLGARMVTPTLFALLFLTIISGHIVLSEGTYLRAFKREPFMGQSLAICILTVTAALLTGKRWGTAGIVSSYFICSGILGLLVATVIFRRSRGHTSCRIKTPWLVRSTDDPLHFELTEKNLMHRHTLSSSKPDADRDTVVLADLRATGPEHGEINHFFLHFYKNVLNARVHLFAEKGQVEYLVHRTPVDFQASFWKTFSRTRLYTVFLREVMSGPRLIRVILHARRHRAVILHILFLSHFAHVAARLILKAFSPRCPVLLTMHGELESLLKHESRFWKLDYWFPKSTRISAHNIHPILLGENIKREMQALGFDISKCLTIEHPYTFDRPRKVRPELGKPLAVGTLGVASLTKGSELLFELAQRFEAEIGRGEISFRHVGRLHSNMKGHTKPLVLLSEIQSGFVEEGEYKNLIVDLDAVLFLYPRSQYRLTASGALFDAIRHNRRIIAFPTSYFKWVLRSVPSDMVVYAGDLDEVESTLKGWLRGFPPVQSDPYLAVRREHSIESVEDAFLAQLIDKLGIHFAGVPAIVRR